MLKYFAALLKNVFNKKPTNLPPAASWKDILKDKEVPVSPKKRRAMLIPSNRVLLWKTEETMKGKKKQIQTGLNVMFQFYYEDIPYIIKTQRAFDQKFVSEALPKISVLMKKKVFRDKADTSEKGLSIKLSQPSDAFVTEEFTINDFADDFRITSLLVNDSEFKVIREGIPINSVTLALTPIAEQFCMPTIIFNVKKTPVQLHWFVKNEKRVEKVEKSGPTKKDVDSLELSFKDEGKREYNLNGYIFRHTGPYFVPHSDDVDRLVAVVVETGSDNPVYAAISSRPVSESPGDILTDDQVRWCEAKILKEENGNIIRVMSYNILADLYLNLNLPQEELFFNYCPKAYQRIFYRTPIFLKQIHSFINAQVSLFFLQEVDLSRHENFIKPFLETVNYSSEISKKMGTISEGVAVIFDKKRFRSICTKSFGVAELAASEEINTDVRRILETSKDSNERFTTRPTIVHIVMLEDLNNGMTIICTNTHLHHNPQDEHVKLLQALVCTRKLMELYNEKKLEEPERDVRILFGGDFNSTPDGAVFNLLKNGFLPKEHEVWKCDEKVVAEDLSIDQKMECLTGTPEYTNYTSDSQKEGFVGCLDYIWGIGVSTIRICPLPDHEKVIRYKALPSAISPSDHLPIICDIKL